MSIAIAKNHMAEMNMLGMLAVFDKTLAEATRDKISYSEFVDILLQAEADYRQERKTANRIKAAKFTVRPAFEDFDFTAKRSITKAEIKEIYTLGWLNDARPLLLIGQTGVGKGLYLSGGRPARLRKWKIGALRMSITALLENLTIARSGGTYLRYRDKLAGSISSSLTRWSNTLCATRSPRLMRNHRRAVNQLSPSPLLRSFP